VSALALQLPAEPVDCAGIRCDKCGSTDDVQLCLVDRSDVDWCADCRDLVWCGCCGEKRAACWCGEDGECEDDHAADLEDRLAKALGDALDAQEDEVA
jgi:hypothetical protein